MLDFQKKKKSPPVINLTALMDIAFILLIFIVLAANFNRIREFQVDLPEVDVGAQPNPKALFITVPIKGHVLVQGKKIEMSELAKFLQGKSKQYESLSIMADKNASIQRAMEALSIASESGFTSIGIATKSNQ